MQQTTQCLCGNALLDEIAPDTVTTTEGTKVVMRRNTDYVLCFKCLNLYTVTGLRTSEEPSKALFSHLISVPPSTDQE